MDLCPDTSTSSEQAVGTGSLQFGLTMVANLRYLFASTTACWIAQGASPTASAGAGSMLVPPNTIVVIDGTCGAKLAVIQDSVAGKASLTQGRMK